MRKNKKSVNPPSQRTFFCGKYLELSVVVTHTISLIEHLPIDIQLISNRIYRLKRFLEQSIGYIKKYLIQYFGDKLLALSNNKSHDPYSRKMKKGIIFGWQRRRNRNIIRFQEC